MTQRHRRWAGLRCWLGGLLFLRGCVGTHYAVAIRPVSPDVRLAFTVILLFECGRCGRKVWVIDG